MSTRVAVYALLLAATFIVPLGGQRVTMDMSPTMIAEAIRVGLRTDAKVVGELVKEETDGWLTHPIPLAHFSTPYLRVAMMARSARRTYRPFTPDDVTPAMLAPELHVYAYPAARGALPANWSRSWLRTRVEEVSDTEKQARALHPP